MNMTAEQHAEKAEELTARADLLSEELNWDQPSARAQLDDLRHAASAHLRLARLLAHEAPKDLCARASGGLAGDCLDTFCNQRPGGLGRRCDPAP